VTASLPLRQLLELSSVPELNLVIEAKEQVWQTLETQIKKLEKELERQSAEDPNEKIYRSVPGIGPLGARILSNELGDLSQFDNERQLFSVCRINTRRTIERRPNPTGTHYPTGKQSSPTDFMRGGLAGN
jgi:hypothetical protein